MHDLIKRTLTKIGLTLVGATDSEKGMQMVRETKPKLLLLDVLMPGRDGWSILRECKSDPELKDMPVIMVSQLNQDTLANSLGADDYITKPIDRELFLKTIKKLLGDKPSANNTILVIDDDENTRDLLSRMLKEGGWNPKTAKDGKEGLNQLKEEPALIVLDLEMPRMDGLTFLKKINLNISNAQFMDEKFTFIDCPRERSSDGLLILLQDMSVICKRASTPFKSIKTPQSVRFFTTP